MTLPAPDAIAVRGYSEPADFAPRKPSQRPDSASKWSVVFDTETTVCPAQDLRVGVYRIYEGQRLHEAGAFHRPGALSERDMAVLQAYCARKKMTLRTLASFSESVLLRVGYDLGGTVIGFNLPFDISRVAIHHGPARGSMRGGFSFQLVESRNRPRIQVKHLSRSAALIQLSSFWDQPTPRGMRKRRQKVERHNGYFVDLKTAAAALLSQSHSLESLCEALGTVTRKRASEAHGGPLSDAYLDYACDDVQASWECFLALQAEYARHGLTRGLHRILSEASLGKAYFQQMGIQPLLACAPDTPRGPFGEIMCAYYGGRAEVRLRRMLTEVIYTDFKSMYPTVNALMGLWRFVIGQGYIVREATAEIRELANVIKREDFQKSETWQRLPAIVRIRPDGDLLPTRAKYDGQNNTIGLNYLTHKGDICYALADIVSARILTGKAPEILEALIFEPGPLQSELQDIQLFGDPDFVIDPVKDDFFTRLIDLRDEAKAKGDKRQLAIKILANSTCYGIFIEIQNDSAPKPECIHIAGMDGAFANTESKAIETPGNYYFPILGVTITAAARLMLALAERETLAQGLQWAFCDTDSLAIARPEGMSRVEFQTRAKAVIDWFAPLNPYRKPGSILQMEALNFGPDGQIEPLYAFAISAKRYALFNIDCKGRPVIRKASAHGLGHLIPPYGADDPAQGGPDPVVPLAEIGVHRWQYDLWYAILKAALAGTPDIVTLDYHPALQKPAAMRYGATSPRLLEWMRHYNVGKPYHQQIRPFGFMMGFQARHRLQRRFTEDFDADPHQRGRPAKTPDPKPVAAFDRDPALAASRAFDRETGEPLGLETMQTYAEALARYHISPETKFENADFTDSGETRRRHVVAGRVEFMGKEGNGGGAFD